MKRATKYPLPASHDCEHCAAVAGRTMGRAGRHRCGALDYRGEDLPAHYPRFSTVDMQTACKYHRNMPNIQIRNVPEALHRILKAKAAIEGSSLSDFVRAELEQIAKRPTHRELRTRLRRRDPVHLSPTAADIIREFRDRD